MKIKFGGFFGLLVIVLLFVLFSFLVQTNLEFFEKLIIDDFLGMGVYILLTIAGVVLAPIVVLPLIVVATSLWGWVVAGIITIFGWTVGAVIAFIIARKFGVSLIERFVSLEGVYKLQEKTQVGNNFWSVLVLRMMVPVDILSYALGLFSKIGLLPYAIATIIGISPFAFVFAYLGEVPFVYQIVLGLVFLIVFLSLLIFREIFMKSKNK